MSREMLDHIKKLNAERRKFDEERAKRLAAEGLEIDRLGVMRYIRTPGHAGRTQSQSPARKPAFA